jgi:hypothetical protein
MVQYRIVKNVGTIFPPPGRCGKVIGCHPPQMSSTLGMYSNYHKFRGRGNINVISRLENPEKLEKLPRKISFGPEIAQSLNAPEKHGKFPRSRGR